MTGVFTILAMPFDERSRVDLDSLQNLVDFQLHAGVHGIGVALGSEIMRFTEPERALVTRTVVQGARGRVPVVINSSGAGTEQAVHYGRLAQENGADALMVSPPSGMPIGGDEVREYYRAVSDATALPIFLQDTPAYHVGADLIRQIAEESGRVKYAKVESPPTPLMVEEAVRKAGSVVTVFGGAGGDYFIEEMRRGSQGMMPGCSSPEDYIQVWDLFRKGEEKKAREVFYRRIVPVNRLTGQGWSAFFHVHKEILKYRGVIRSAKVRGPVTPLDETTRRELQQLMEELYSRDGHVA